MQQRENVKQEYKQFGEEKTEDAINTTVFLNTPVSLGIVMRLPFGDIDRIIKLLQDNKATIIFKRISADRIYLSSKKD